RGSGTPAASAKEPSNALYCVIDLSAGPDAGKYPVSYLAAEPKGGWTDEYKTTKLVLRRIEPGKFKMGGEYEVTLTKPFYCGIFEVTQKQYELVTGSNPSQFKGDMRPVEKVSYDMIRGKNAGAKWPASSAVDSSSFIGKIRERTGIEGFDLSTEAQWEYACRAGTTSKYNNGGDTEADLKKLGRFVLNQAGRAGVEPDASFTKHEPDGKGGCSGRHTVVGSYLPNAWGLYDMHGNMWEWCLDWHGDLSSGVTDPVGPSSGERRVGRSGCWYTSAVTTTSFFRFLALPSHGKYINGFRLARTLSK
ncbi:MAG: formylglycine-generating enzyme family protein, partial [Kiritimatiellae bacterium]|nr:formylglycine-generating enzyme family protein [Kiritimatiellia bacterium]